MDIVVIIIGTRVRILAVGVMEAKIFETHKLARLLLLIQILWELTRS